MKRSFIPTLAAFALAMGAGASDAHADYSFVTSSDIGGTWFNASPQADTRSGGTASIAAGPAGAGALGAGSLRMTSDSSIAGGSQAKAQFVTFAYAGTKLSDITGISFQDYRVGTSTTAAAQRIGLNIEVDYLGNGSSFTTLVFEPVYQTGGVGALLDNTWQPWDAYKNGNAIWWSSQAIPGVCAFSCYVSWNAILAANPNAKITGSGRFAFNIGSGWIGQFSGAADGLTIRTAAGTDTYDFEPTAPAPTNIALVVTPSSTVYDSKNVTGVSGDFAPGFPGGSLASNGTAKTDMYFPPSMLFGRDIALGEVASVTYWTKKGTVHSGGDPGDWFLNIYTKPYAGQIGGSFYGTRIGSDPYFSQNLTDPVNTWNLWSSDGPTNWTRFYESTYGYFGSYTDPHWDAFVGGTSLAGSRGPGVPYATQPVLFFSLQTASAWAAGFTGQLDGFTVELSNGSVATVNFEADDSIAPTLTGSASPVANGFGWNNTSVTVSFTCTDNPGGSGVSAASNYAGGVLSAEGAGQSFTNTGNCYDNVGNVAASATVSGINIDKTNPTFGACSGQSFAYGTGTQPVSITASDSLSGIDTAGSTLSGTVNTNVVGTTTVNYTAKDKAGNTATTSCNYQVSTPNQVKQQVLADLQALLPSLAKPASDKVKSAITHIQKSLDPKYWVDGLHLTKDGKPVFDEEKKAVHDLEDVNPPIAAVSAAINALVADDRALATVAIAESTKKPSDIQKANDEIAKGDADRNAGKFEEAVGHYKNAWDLAT